MYIKASDLRNGVKVEHDGDIWVVSEVMHRTPGNLRAFVQARMTSLTNGRNRDERFRSTEQVRAADLETKKMQFLYREDHFLNFMDQETYDQIQIDTAMVGESAGYLTDGLEVMVQFRDGKPLGVELPAKVVLKIIETEPGVKGDTVSNVTKAAKTEAGKVVQVPIFVNEGESIRVSTATGEYVERA